MVLKKFFSFYGRMDRLTYFLRFTVLWLVFSALSIFIVIGILYCMLEEDVLYLIALAEGDPKFMMQMFLYSSPIWVWIWIILGAIFGLAYFTLVARRLHDVGRSGWWCLLFLLYALSFSTSSYLLSLAVSILLVVFSFYLIVGKGFAGTNRFGDDPVLAKARWYADNSPTASEAPQDITFGQKYFNTAGRVDRLSFILRVMVIYFVPLLIIYALAIITYTGWGINMTNLDPILIANIHYTTGLVIYSTIADIILGILLITGVVAFFMLAVRRMHDRNKSGWHIVRFILPIIFAILFWAATTMESPAFTIVFGLLMLASIIDAGVLFFLLIFRAGTMGDNRFGADPVYTRSHKYINAPASLNRLY